MRRSLLVTFAILWLTTIATAQSHAPAPTPTAAPASGTAAAKPTKPASAPPVHVTPGTHDSAPAKTAAKPKTDKRAQAKSAEDLEELVARVRRRIADEQQQSQASSRVAGAGPPRVAPTSRVKLVWRPGVVWPAELLETAASPPQDGRVKVTWDRP